MPNQEHHDETVAEAAGNAVELNDVSVTYRLPTEKLNSIKEFAIKRLLGQLKYHHFDALKNVSLTVKQGQVFGIVGRNGAGKSTLLKVVSRVLVPTSGDIIVRGRVSPLLELGAGFHPDLTGAENVFLNGALLGYTRSELNEKYDQIVEFSGIGEHINAPIRGYSSGMVARLGFAIAVAKDPEILILDEVLSVGDAAFQEKSTQRLREIMRNPNTTILLVTHTPNMIAELCDHAVILEHGIVYAQGTGEEMGDLYDQIVHGSTRDAV